MEESYEEVERVKRNSRSQSRKQTMDRKKEVCTLENNVLAMVILFTLSLILIRALY